MRVAIAADHAGFDLKQLLVDSLRRNGHQVDDLEIRLKKALREGALGGASAKPGGAEAGGRRGEGLPAHLTAASEPEVAPPVAEICLDGDRLKPGYLASINGRVFVTDAATRLQDGDSVLILSADVGG